MASLCLSLSQIPEDYSFSLVLGFSYLISPPQTSKIIAKMSIKFYIHSLLRLALHHIA